MDLLLIRHALPVRVAGAVGPADPALSEHGRRQAVALAEWLAAEPVDALVTSPMVRAVQTAEPLSVERGLEAEVVEGIAEFDRDALDYVPIEEMRAEGDPRWYALLAGDVPEGFQELVVGAVEDVIARNRGRTVVAVCHGGVINAYLAHLLDLDRPLFFEPFYTGISRVRASSDGARSLLSVNESAHLRGVGLTP